MEHFITWMKGIVLLFFVFTALLYFIPRNTYKKYIRFFMEMMLILAIMYPLLQAVFKENTLENLIHYDEFWQEMDNMKLDAEHFEEEQNAYYLKECEENIEEDVKQLIFQHGYEVKSVEVKLNTSYEIEDISLVVEQTAKEQKNEDILLIQQEILNFYQIEENKLQFKMQ
ncbi:MAG: stage III sporulation protein AF [Lachnospiraceae bacterium]|nr:stage III sporulation protein AF [Lachnospiraceae bacterium]